MPGLFGECRAQAPYGRRSVAHVRRGGGPRGGRKRIEPAITLYGGNNFDTTNRLGGATGGAYRGNTAGFTIAVLHQIDTQVDQARLLDYLDSSGKGYDFFQASATTVVFRAGNAAGNAFLSSPAYSPASYIGKIQLLVGRHTGASGVVDLWATRQKVATGTSTTGYTLPATSFRQSWALRGNGTAAHTGLTIYGVSAYDSSLSDNAILALYDAVYSTGRLPTASTVNCHNVANSVSGASFPTTITDQVGSETLSFYAGAASGVDLVTRTGKPSQMFAWTS